MRSTTKTRRLTSAYVTAEAGVSERPFATLRNQQLVIKAIACNPPSSDAIDFEDVVVK
jgi:hypothetical protein